MSLSRENNPAKFDGEMRAMKKWNWIGWELNEEKEEIFNSPKKKIYQNYFFSHKNKQIILDRFTHFCDFFVFHFKHTNCIPNNTFAFDIDLGPPFSLLLFSRICTREKTNVLMCCVLCSSFCISEAMFAWFGWLRPSRHNQHRRWKGIGRKRKQEPVVVRC